MSKRRRPHHGGGDHAEENSERWLLTYADMITLLLALFIVLFSISSINQKKFLALALGLKETFNPNPGVLQSGNGLLNNTSLTKTAGSTLNPALHAGTVTSTTLAKGSSQGGGQAEEGLSQISQKIQAALRGKGLSANVSMAVTTRGLVVQILADKVFFETGSADLGSVGQQIVDVIGSVVKPQPYNINVEGYTDNQPLVGGPYGSNEELSAVRAVNVVLALEQDDGIGLDRMSATGFGDTHPLAPNTTAANMALNRRIDVVILAPQETQP